jgi:hypothetical protein
VDPRAGVDAVEKRKFVILPGLELRPLCRPARGQSLYRLRLPGSLYIIYRPKNAARNSKEAHYFLPAISTDQANLGKSNINLVSERHPRRCKRRTRETDYDLYM